MGVGSGKRGPPGFSYMDTDSRSRVNNVIFRSFFRCPPPPPPLKGLKRVIFLAPPPPKYICKLFRVFPLYYSECQAVNRNFRLFDQTLSQIGVSVSVADGKTQLALASNVQTPRAQNFLRSALEKGTSFVLLQ